MGRTVDHSSRTIDDDGQIEPVKKPGLLLSVVAIGALAAGVATSLAVFYFVAIVAGLLIAPNLSGKRRTVIRALDRFQDRTVEVRVWGVPPPLPSGTTLVLTSVAALGAGFHVYFQASSGASIHLKVAQPGTAQITDTAVVIASARYVQWISKRLPIVDGAPAVSIALAPDRRPTG